MSSSQLSEAKPFYGVVDTTMNALRLILAARKGVIPRVIYRLSNTERSTMIKSGAVFVSDVEESKIKRWTDGLVWSESRIVGNFLVYRELNERTNSRGSHKKLYPKGEPSRALSVRPNSQARFHNALIAISGLQTSEYGTFKPNGLIKKTITVTIEGSDLHLISYYTSADQHSGKLKRPTSRPDIMSLPMDPPPLSGDQFSSASQGRERPGWHLLACVSWHSFPPIPSADEFSIRETEEAPSDVAECKMEDERYSVSVSATSSGSDSSQGSPIENSFAGDALFSVSSQSASIRQSATTTCGWSQSLHPARTHGPRIPLPLHTIPPRLAETRAIRTLGIYLSNVGKARRTSRPRHTPRTAAKAR
ncbi:Gti1/Pac2 family-domain-containing protein [Mycena leptocephala]|nr:Gti1/Pac2 family-domain-containing protein [Mycena leptocephala]